MKRVMLVTHNKRMAESIEQLCELLSYSTRTLSHVADALLHSQSADLLIIDGVGQDVVPLMAQLKGLPQPFPVLWVLDQRMGLPRERCLYHPFTIEQAIQAIQRAIFRPGMSEHRHTLDGQLLADLLWAGSEQQILQRMSLSIAESFPCGAVGVFILDDKLRERWIHWLNPPDPLVQSQLSEAMQQGENLIEGWKRFVFTSDEMTGAVFVQQLQPIEADAEKVLNEIIGVSLHIWGREVSLNQSQRHIDQLRTFEILGQSIVAQLDARQALELIVSSIRHLVKSSAAVVWLRQEQHVVMVAQSGHPIPARLRLEADYHAISLLLQSTRPYQLTHAESQIFFPNETGIQVLSMSLMLNNHNIGLIQAVRQRQEDSFDTGDEWRLRSLAAWAVIAINNSRLHYKAHQALARERQSRAKIIQLDKLTELGRLTAGIAHEINNALQAAYGALSSGIATGQMVGEDVEVLQNTLDQIAQVVQKVRSTYRSANAEPQQANVNQIADQVIDMLTWQLRNREVVLLKHLSPNLPLIRAFPHELRQVILNLMMNAIDALDESTNTDKQIELETGFDTQRRLIFICIRDNGIGMTESQVVSIFEPFYTTKPEGSGLGLSICNDIVRHYGGQMEVHTRLGSGTSFTVWLPEHTPAEEHSLSLNSSSES